MPLQSQCIGYRSTGGGVVENAPGGHSGGKAVPQVFSQTLQIFVGILAVVDPRFAMQAPVDQPRPTSRLRIGNEARRARGNLGDAQIDQHRLSRLPAGVPGLQRYRPVIPLPQAFEETSRMLGGMAKRWRQLYQQATQAVAQLPALSKKPVQRVLAPAEPLLMADDLGHLHRKAEMLWYGRSPTGIGFRAMGPVEGTVDFHRIEAGGVALQVAAGCANASA